MLRLLLVLTLLIPQLAFADRTFYSAFSLVPGATAQGSVLLQDGTASLPATAFASQPNTGIFRTGPNVLGFSVNGFERAQVNASGLSIVSGQTFGLVQSAASPTYTFSSDPDTGIYQGGANILGLATGGLARFTIGTTGDFIQDATNGGDIIMARTGRTLSLQEATPASACMGIATPNGVTNVTVTTSCAVTGARIFYSRVGAVTNMASISTTTAPAGASFTFASTNAADTLASSVVYMIIKESA